MEPIKPGSTVKTLRRQRQGLDGEIERLRVVRKDTEHELNQLLDQRSRLDEQIAAILRAPQVSEHAVLRYLERVKGIDVAGVSAAILTESTLRAIETLGSAEIPLGDGYKAIVKNKTVVTIE